MKAWGSIFGGLLALSASGGAWALAPVAPPSNGPQVDAKPPAVMLKLKPPEGVTAAVWRQHIDDQQGTGGAPKTSLQRQQKQLDSLTTGTAGAVVRRHGIIAGIGGIVTNGTDTPVIISLPSQKIMLPSGKDVTAYRLENGVLVYKDPATHTLMKYGVAVPEAAGSNKPQAKSGTKAVAAAAGQSGSTITATVPTGVGNNFKTVATGGIVETDGTSFDASYSVNLTYTDASGYMKDASGQPAATINAWVSTVSANGSIGPTTIPLQYTSEGRYVTTAPFTTLIGGMEGSYTPVHVAFVGPRGQWDSNNSANYDIGIGHP